MKVAHRVPKLTFRERNTHQECTEKCLRRDSRNIAKKCNCFPDNPPMENISQSNEEQDLPNLFSCRRIQNTEVQGNAAIP